MDLCKYKHIHECMVHITLQLYIHTVGFNLTKDSSEMTALGDLCCVVLPLKSDVGYSCVRMDALHFLRYFNGYRNSLVLIHVNMH